MTKPPNKQSVTVRSRRRNSWTEFFLMDLRPPARYDAATALRRTTATSLYVFKQPFICGKRSICFGTDTLAAAQPNRTQTITPRLRPREGRKLFCEPQHSSLSRVSIVFCSSLVEDSFLVAHFSAFQPCTGQLGAVESQNSGCSNFLRMFSFAMFPG